MGHNSDVNTPYYGRVSSLDFAVIHALKCTVAMFVLSHGYMATWSCFIICY